MERNKKKRVDLMEEMTVKQSYDVQEHRAYLHAKLAPERHVSGVEGGGWV